MMPVVQLVDDQQHRRAIVFNSRQRRYIYIYIFSNSAAEGAKA